MPALVSLSKSISLTIKVIQCSTYIYKYASVQFSYFTELDYFKDEVM